MQRDRFGHPVKGKIAQNVAALRPGPSHAAALKGDVGKFFRI